MYTTLYLFFTAIVSFVCIMKTIPFAIIPCILAIMMVAGSFIIISSEKKQDFWTVFIAQIIQLIFIMFNTVIFCEYDYFPVCAILTINIFFYFFLEQQLNKWKETSNFYSSLYDPLTNLLNRRGLIEAIESEKEANKKFYLMFCDLDNFKQLNDTLGHEAGDELLKDISKLWSNINGFKYNLCRLGGDEFAVLVEEGKKSKVESMAKKMLEILKNQKTKYFKYISASIGIASFPEDADDTEQLLKFADSAMYKAKESGKNAYVFFDKTIYKEMVEKYETEKYLINSIRDYKFEIVYQPQVNAKNGKIIGFEALARLKNTNGEFMKTQDFILVAENSGLIFDIDKIILEKTLSEAKKLLEIDPETIISVNMSGKHISLDGFTELVYDTVQNTEFPIKNLKLEITESSYVRQLDAVAKKIAKLKKFGVKIALDDFGTGYSSLSYLSKIPIDTIKIDKTFVDEMKNNNSFINLIINLGHFLGCDIIAEGVENIEQYNMLQILNCDIIQGFLFGKPKSLEETKKLLQGDNFSA